MRHNVKKIFLIAGFLVILPVLLNSCGGGGGGSSGDTTASSVQVVSCPTSSTTNVAIQGFAFSPASVTVTADSVVKWTNLDNTKHTVTSATVPANGAFNSAVLPGASVCLKFTSGGTYNYYCSIHTYMLGVVTVQ